MEDSMTSSGSREESEPSPLSCGYGHPRSAFVAKESLAVTEPASLTTSSEDVELTPSPTGLEMSPDPALSA
jgi:hypothetical protein